MALIDQLITEQSMSLEPNYGDGDDAILCSLLNTIYNKMKLAQVDVLEWTDSNSNIWKINIFDDRVKLMNITQSIFFVYIFDQEGINLRIQVPSNMNKLDALYNAIPIVTTLLED